MKSVRVIARLDVKGPNVVKGVQFEALRVMGKPSDLAGEYSLQGADELIYLDIVASLYKRANLLHIVREASKHIHIPFTAGGGVRTIEDIRDLLQAGADKVAINTAAILRPELIREAATLFGSQCIVVSIEAKRKGNGWEAFTDNGRQATGRDVVAWAKEAQDLGAGEILLTSVDREGTKRGLDRALISAVASAVRVPLIISGGTSSASDAALSVRESGADAVAVASILHYGEATVADIKDALVQEGVAVREPSSEERARRMKAEKDVDVYEYNRFTLRQFDTPAFDIDPHAHSEDLGPFLEPQEADVCVVNYELNNVRSVVAGLESLGKRVSVVQTPEGVAAARRIILPGVGAFGGGMDSLRARGLIEPLRMKAQEGTPFLGVCLGMQLLFSESEEFGRYEGLGLIDGKVVSFPSPSKGAEDFKLPHIGWNTLQSRIGNDSLWKGSILRDTAIGESVYFVHSFYPIPSDPTHTLAASRYGGVDFAAVVRKGNISGAQFHPEKSSATGLRMLAAFCEENTA